MKRFFSIRAAIVVLTVASVWLSSTRLRLSNNLADLFPDTGAAAMLTRYLKAFGGGDLGLVLVRGEDPNEVRAASRAIEGRLATCPSVARVLSDVRPPPIGRATEAWALAGPSARAKLRSALEPEGMRERLDESRRLLLAPGAGELASAIERDPLRLTLIPWEDRPELAAGMRVQEDGALITPDSKAELVVVEPKGNAFLGPDARAFVTCAEDAMRAVETERAVTTGLTGGHAIAVATERMLRRDLILSSILSTVLASVLFLVTFRRARALIAIMPPLALGTTWTTGIAAFFPDGLSAIAVAFGAVVVGVGVDTGVHVYAAVLHARKEGHLGRALAAEARKRTWRPTLAAALVAGLAFGSLGLSDLSAVRQLGLLCAGGEVLTAIAILLIAPDVGAWLERRGMGHAPSSRWHTWLADAIGDRKRAAFGLALALLPALALTVTGLPERSNTLVAIRPKALEPLKVQSEIFRLFDSHEGQWIVVSTGSTEVQARGHADAVAEALDLLRARGLVDGFDSMTSLLPTPRTQAARFAERDGLDLQKAAARLQEVASAIGFDPEALAPAFDDLRSPRKTPLQLGDTDLVRFVRARHLAHDQEGYLAVTYVRPHRDPDTEAKARAAIHAADPEASITGYQHLETALGDALGRELPIIAFVSLLVALLAMRGVLRRGIDVAIVGLCIASELGLVFACMRLLHLRWHVYDALVLPVLIGITMDEAMFLLYAARARADLPLRGAIRGALDEQAPLIVATALTTAVGFGALLVCRFEGLFDLGAVGAIGSLVGLLSALLVVPAALVLLDRPKSG